MFVTLLRCTKPHGHEGRHKMEHGNLENTRFVANQEEFDLDGRKCASLSSVLLPAPLLIVASSLLMCCVRTQAVKFECNVCTARAVSIV